MESNGDIHADINAKACELHLRAERIRVNFEVLLSKLQSTSQLSDGQASSSRTEVLTQGGEGVLRTVMERSYPEISEGIKQLSGDGGAVGQARRGAAALGDVAMGVGGEGEQTKLSNRGASAGALADGGADAADEGESDPRLSVAPGDDASSPPRAAAQAACTEGKGKLAALLLRGDETLLRAAFASHADGRDSADQPIMSKEALVKALDALHVQRGDEEIDELMTRVDLDGNGTIDCQEFLQAIQGRSHLEMLLFGLPIVRALADQLGGSTVAYRKIHDDDVQDLVLSAVPLIVEIIQRNLASLRASAEAREAVSDAAQNSAGKFAFSIQGGDLQDFHAGLAERVGEPHADIARGMEKEHLDSNDADIPFRTANYGILTTPRKEWQLVESGGKGLADGDTRVLRPLEDLERCETAQEAGITRPELRAVVLYTGPMYQIYNGRLRGFGDSGQVEEGMPPKSVAERCEEAQNNYSSTIHALVSAVKKLQKPERGWLYRGLSGGQLPRGFRTKGFAEWAFMSTTTSLEVALAYSGVQKGLTATVLRIEVSDVDGAASIQEFSQYPGEEEWLWNVLTYLQYRVGEEELCTTPWGLVRMISVKANSNGSHKTVEQLEDRRKQMCVEMLRECYMSAQRLLSNIVESEEFRSRITEGKPGELARNSAAEANAMVKATVRECKVLMNRRAGEKSSWYNIDGNLRLAVQDALTIIPLALGKVQLWMETTMTAYDLNCVPMRECKMRRITRAALQLDDAIDRLAQEEVLESARKLCHLRGLIVVPLGLDKVDDNGEAPLYWAATRGGTDDVRILLDAGANVNALLSFSAATLQREAPEEVENYDAVAVQASEMVAETRYSALHGAAINGRAETVEMLLKRGADINMCVSGSGRWPTGCSALMLASANGCNRVVERLLAYNACTEKRGESGYTALMLAARNGKAKVVQMLLSKGADVKAVREFTLMDSSKTITTTALDLAQRSRAGGIEGAAECVELLTKHLS